MYCPFCGKDNSDEWVFCSGCGRQLPTEATPKAQVPREPTSQAMATFGFATTAAPPQVAQPEPQLADREAKRVWVDTPTPWRRYFARMIDYMIWAFTFGILLNLFGVDTKDINKYGLSMLTEALWIPLEAIFLATCGNTLGKWLLALRVRAPGDCRIDLGTAVGRSALVWVKGLWFGLPLVALVGLTISYNNLKLRGATSWDVTCSTTVLHTRMDAKRITLLVGIAALFCIILVLIASLE